MVERIDIERALQDLISNEEGMRFQGLAVALLQKTRWPELIACERKNDRGLDAYARPDLSFDKIGKGLACSLTAELTKINADAETAIEHWGPFSLLIFATPAKVTRQKAEGWETKIRERFGVDLLVVSREEFITALLRSENADFCRSHLKIAVPLSPSIQDIATRTREAAEKVAANWAGHPRLFNRPRIALSAEKLDQNGRGTREFSRTEELRSALSDGRRIVLEGPAGRGKTTTLIDLAQGTGQYGVALLVDLPGWAKSKLGILEYVVQDPAFQKRHLDAVTLARLSEAEPLVFLLNGWNEVGEVHLEEMYTALREVERAFPTAGILVATRAHHSPPSLPRSTRYQLLPLTPEQRTQYLESALDSDRARELDIRISSDPSLEQLTRTPFILSEVVTLHRSGLHIPHTKFDLLRAVLDVIEDAEEHRIHLRSAPLQGRAEDYLSSLASELTAGGEAAIEEADARRSCMHTAERLQNAKQISQTPEPQSILGALSAHHILERHDHPAETFRFEHQQFQEYYAALALRGKLMRLSKSSDPVEKQALLHDCLNRPTWEQPIRLIAESLTARHEDVLLGRALVLMALEVDPVFAGHLSRLAGAAVWAEVREQVGGRLRSLHASPNENFSRLALVGMMATGSVDFQDLLVPLLRHEDEQVRLRTYHSGELYTSSLGADWLKEVAAWQDSHRLEFLDALARPGTASELWTLAESDPSPTLRELAAQYLLWFGQQERGARLFAGLPEPIFASAIRRMDTKDVPSASRDRAVSALWTSVEDSSDPNARLATLLQLEEFHDSAAEARMMQELSNLATEEIKSLAHQVVRSTFTNLIRNHREFVSHLVAEWIRSGAVWGEYWQSLVQDVPTSTKDVLLQRLGAEDMRPDMAQRRSAVWLLSRSADTAAAQAAFEQLRRHRVALNATRAARPEDPIDEQLLDLLRAIPPPLVFEGVAGVISPTTVETDVRILLDLYGFRRHDVELVKADLPEAARQVVRGYLKGAINAVLEEADARWQTPAELSLLLAAIGDPEDMADLAVIVKRDVERMKSPKRGFMSYSNWHVQALLSLDHVSAEPLLMDLLRERTYEEDAAWALVAIAETWRDGMPASVARGRWPASVEEPGKAAGLNDGVFDEVRRQRSAGTIRERMVVLLASHESLSGHGIGEKTSPFPYRLKVLAKALAVLDAKGSSDLIQQVAGLPAGYDDKSTRVDILERLMANGEVLSTDRVVTIMELSNENLAQTKYLTADDAKPIKRALRILPFTTAPGAGIDAIRRLLSAFGWQLFDDRLFMTFGRCGLQEGLSLLREIASRDADFFAGSRWAFNWIDAVSACPLAEADDILLSFVDSDISEGSGASLSEAVEDHLARQLGRRAKDRPALADRIARLCAVPGSQKRRLILAKVVAAINSASVLLAGLDLLDDGAVQPIPWEFPRTLEDLFLEKRPYQGRAGWYSLVPREADGIRTRLYEMLASDPKRANSAYELLGQIEVWRSEHGRPPFEPRCPELALAAWPPRSPSLEERLPS